MSNISDQTELPCRVDDGGPAVRHRIQPRDTDLGGFSVRRLLPVAECRSVGPWVFFDHMGPADFAAGEGVNVRPHPHIGLATVSYLFEGEMLHRDSLGNEQCIVPGDINLMTAGRGIVHSEREREAFRARPHRTHGLQLWLALPAEDEECEPSFDHYPSDAIPKLDVDGVPVRVLIGSAWGAHSPVVTRSPTLYAEAKLAAGQSLRLPAAAERAVYAVDGALSISGCELPAQAMAVVEPGRELVVSALAPARLAIIGGEPLGARHMNWNFVSSRRERITRAREDWAAGRFPTVPGDAEEFIPLPD